MTSSRSRSRGRRRLVAPLGLALVAGCALKGDVRKVGLQVEGMQAQMAHADSQRATQLDSVIALMTQVQQVIAAEQAVLTRFRGDTRNDLLNVQQQLVTVQELTGQSQQRLTELRSQIEARAQQQPASDTAGGAQPIGNIAATPGPDQMYDLSLQHYRSGRLATARAAFRDFLKYYPTHAHAPDALYFIGESFAQDQPDSAAAVYDLVVKTYPNSSRAPSALYKLGLLAEQRGDKAGARTLYQRVVSGYPRSDEANLARDKLQRLGH